MQSFIIRFPKDAVRRTKWIEAIWPPHIRREPARKAHVCSKHFLEEHFDRTSAFKVRLREHAVPTLLLPHPVQQGDRVPDSASTESSFDSPQLMQGGAEGLLLLAQVNILPDHHIMLTGRVVLEECT
ncbi:hypothetical protein MRX96_053664 [Rhipicephalus microplus]